jgi:hypothetical protein
MNINRPSKAIYAENKARFTLGVEANKNLGPTLSIIWGCKLAPRVANWPPKLHGILFFSLGANKKAHKVQHLLVLVYWGRLKSFSLLQP